MKAIILAAGYATRLYPLTENFPKPLLPVGGRPILDWLLSDVSPLMEETIVVANHRFYPVFAAWSADKSGVRVIDDGTTANENRLGAVRDIQLAQAEGDCLVMAGDNVLTFSLRPFIRYSLGKKASCVMCYEEKRPEALRRTAVIATDAEGRITSYQEKPKEPKGCLAVPPFYCYRAGDLARVEEALNDGCGADTPGSFAAWLSGKVEMYAWKMPGRRCDIGNLESYEDIRDSYSGPER